MINLDKQYTEYVLSKTDIFRHIHPNILSILGLIMDFFLLHYIIVSSLAMIGLVLFIRYSCDCFDGAVARKYKRVSDFGGALDTIADNTLIFVLIYGILISIGMTISVAVLTAFIVVSVNLVYMHTKNALLHHEHLKNFSSTFDKMYLFGVNNNCLIYSFVFFTLIIIKT